MKKKIIKSFAKINLSLNVLGKNNTNFHKIQSIVSFINLYDKIYIRSTKKNDHSIKFFGQFSSNLENNTVKVLLNILDNKNLLKKKYEIRVIKNIPQKSGLGGGSMNAASLMNFFLKQKIFHLTKKEVFNICNKIGSDVFLGLNNKNLILTNNNTVKTFNTKLGLYAVLIKPKIGCSTKNIYNGVKNFKKSRIKINSKVFKIYSLQNAQNDLEKPAFKIYPILRKLKEFLSNIDEVKFVRMTGSGSTIVAYFSNKKSAINALKLTKRKFKNYWSILSKTI